MTTSDPRMADQRNPEMLGREMSGASVPDLVAEVSMLRPTTRRRVCSNRCFGHWA
jgi:hypothetical protein